jgi:glycosyltransferase involved in cell wall biosynthesis
VNAQAIGRDRRPVLMIVHSYYEEDPRVRREAEALVEAGRAVVVIGLRRDGQSSLDTVAGVAVHRLDVQRHQGAGLFTYLREYLSFGLRASWRAIRLHRRWRFELVQVHSLPDFLVAAALPLRLAGVPLILDLHEAMPEFFRSRFPRASKPWVQGLMRWQERWSIARSTVTLSVNEAMRDRLLRLGVRPDKVVVVPNTPSLRRFSMDRAQPRSFLEDGTLRLVYTGALTPIYEVDVALHAMASLVARRPAMPVCLDIYGRGDTAPALEQLAGELGLGDRVVFHGRIPLDAVPAAVAAADVGLAPTRHDAFTDLSLSTKIYEYAAMGKPVVASRLPLVERTFPGGSVLTYPPGDADALASAILALVDGPELRTATVDRASALVRISSWEHESKGYVALVDRLTNGRGQAMPSARYSVR